MALEFLIKLVGASSPVQPKKGENHQPLISNGQTFEIRLIVVVMARFIISYLLKMEVS